MRPRSDVRSPLLAAWIVMLPAAAGAQPPDLRGDLSMMEAALEKAVRQVSLASAAPFFGESASCRGYRLQGYGAVFVVPPRLVPRRGSVAGVAPAAGAAGKAGVAAAPAGDKNQDPMDQILLQLRAEQQRLGAEMDRGTPTSQASRAARERELRAMEERVEALQREAERARREAEQAFAEVAREARKRAAAASSAGAPSRTEPQATGVAAPAADVPPPLLAPWRFWFGNGPESDPRAPDRVVSDVRAAVAKTLESYGAGLHGVPANEFLVVAVDFVTPWGFDDSVRPERTLIVRVRKGELDKGAAGSLPQEEVRKRIEFVEY